MQARNAAGEMITAQNSAASVIQAGITGRGDRVATSENAKMDAAAASIQASMRGKKSRDAVETLVAEAVKQEALVDIGQRLMACAKSDASVDKSELQSIIEMLFSVTGQCMPGEDAPPNNESIEKKQSSMVNELREQMTSEMAEKLEMEIELKEAMANSLAMEQELQGSRVKVAELQEEAANSFAELEIAKRMTNELQKTAAKEREQLEGENSYLAQQLLLAQQASSSPTRGGSPTPGGTPIATRNTATAAGGLAVRNAKDLPFSSELTSQQELKANAVIVNMQRAGYPAASTINVCKALLLDQSAPAMKAVWEVCDQQRKNYLDVGAFKRALPLIGENVPDDEMDLLFEMADEDGSGKIVFSEFVMLCRALNLQDGF